MNINPKKIPIYIDIAFCLVVLPLVLSIIPIEKMFANSTIFTVILVTFLYVVYFLYRKVRVPSLLMRRQFLKVSVFILSLLVVTDLLAHFPLTDNFIMKLSEGDLPRVSANRVQRVWFLFLVVSGFSLAIDLTSELFRQVIARKEVEEEKDKAELALYKAQINPHFLFNSLNTIYGMIVSRSENTEEAFVKFTDMMKYMYDNSLEDTVNIGRELEYFTTVDSIGQGLPIMLPKGARTIQILQRFVEDEERRRGYQLTKTPLMAKSDLYKISGHWDHYRDGMFILGDPDDETKECFALRPMTCPFQYQVFLNKKRSYRDLPMRLGETSTLFRNEESGEMHGLIRVRQFTISEGHLILTPDQLENEFKGCLDLALYMLDALGLREDCSFRFSQWDPNRTDKYEGTTEQWEEAQSVMKTILDNIGLDYKIGIDEAAFYGPKLDIQIKNVHGKEDTLITIQIDMLLAKKFGMEYTDSNDQRVTPYIIHRTSLGCYERTLALVLEKYAGALPLWMAPEQVRVLPIGVEHEDYAKAVREKLESAGIRTEVDARNEKIGYKIRQAQLEKVPYMLVVGEKEAAEGKVAVRNRGGVDLGAVTVDEFMLKALEEIRTLKLD